MPARLPSADLDALDHIQNGFPCAPADFPHDAGGVSHYRLAERARAGEAMLLELGLPPAGGPGGRREGLMVFRAEAARRVVLMFNGLAERFALSRLLVTDVATHVVMMKDRTRCFGLLGMGELGADHAACVGNLGRILAALGVDEVYCMGISAGGAAAIRFGCEMGARGVLGFSIPTTLDLRDDPGAGMSAYPQLVRLYRRARHLGTDLAGEYAARAVRPSLLLVHSARHRRDAWLAGRMAGMAGVTLLDTRGYDGHDTHQWCVKAGYGRALMERLFAARPVSA